MSRITSDCGWLSPAGEWYPCGIEGLERLARDLLEQAELGHFGDPERALEERGWAKLVPEGGHHRTGFAHWGWEHRPTPGQARALLEWCLGDGQGLTELPACLAPDPEPEDAL
jgi:hypothetical protein